MKYINTPADAALVQITGEPVLNEQGQPVLCKFSTFALGRLTDQAFAASGMDGVLQVMKLREVLKDAQPGDVLAIEDADYKPLVQATRNPSAGYNMAIAHCLVPFMRAICEATNKPPVIALPAAAE